MSRWIDTEAHLALLKGWCDRRTPITVRFLGDPDYRLDCVPLRLDGPACVVAVDDDGPGPGAEIRFELEEIADARPRGGMAPGVGAYPGEPCPDNSAAPKDGAPAEDLLRPVTPEEAERFRRQALKAIDEGRFHAWALSLDPTDDPDMRQIQILMAHLDAFMRTDDTGFADTRMQVSNDPEAHEPRWRRTEDGYSIALCAESGGHWSQVTFQLGYTMMHCLIDHLRPSPEHRVDWAEELICEMAAREMLFELSRDWQGDPLSRDDPDYADALLDYLLESLQEYGTGRLSACGSLRELERLNALGSRQPEARMEEVSTLYRMVCDGDIARLARCARYAVPGTVLLDTRRWLEDEPDSQAVAYVCRLQDRIPGTRCAAGTQALFHMEGSIPTGAQLDAICDYLLSLRDLPGDNIVIQFHDIDAPDDSDDFTGLAFIQACRSDSPEDPYRVEVRLDGPEGFRLLAVKETTAERAMALIRFACLHRRLPEPAPWTDITGEVFGDGYGAEAGGE